MKIAIITNIEKDKDFKITKMLSEKLTLNNFKVLLPENNDPIKEEDIIGNCDTVISLGGDGTFLRVARKACKVRKPILGINIGHLGFLTEADKNDIDKVVQLLSEGKYKVKERMLLEARIINDNEDSNNFSVAINDVVISRGAISRMISIKILLDEQKIDEFPADGLIVSTPIGSTAYSLSAGGPIVEPDMKLILATPICPHSLHARPIVFSENRVLKITIDDKNQDEGILTLDGQKTFKLKRNDIIEIKKSQYDLKYIKLPEKDYFDTIRKKLFLRS